MEDFMKEQHTTEPENSENAMFHMLYGLLAVICIFIAYSFLVMFWDFFVKICTEVVPTNAEVQPSSPIRNRDNRSRDVKRPNSLHRATYRHSSSIPSEGLVLAPSVQFSFSDLSEYSTSETQIADNLPDGEWYIEFRNVLKSGHSEEFYARKEYQNNSIRLGDSSEDACQLMNDFCADVNHETLTNAEVQPLSSIQIRDRSMDIKLPNSLHRTTYRRAASVPSDGVVLEPSVQSLFSDSSEYSSSETQRPNNLPDEEWYMEFRNVLKSGYSEEFYARKEYQNRSICLGNSSEDTCHVLNDFCADVNQEIQRNAEVQTSSSFKNRDRRSTDVKRPNSLPRTIYRRASSLTSDGIVLAPSVQSLFSDSSEYSSSETQRANNLPDGEWYIEFRNVLKSGHSEEFYARNGNQNSSIRLGDSSEDTVTTESSSDNLRSSNDDVEEDLMANNYHTSNF